MITTTGALTILNAHTPAPQVVYGAIPQDMNVAEAKFFNGEILVVKLG